MTPAEKIIEKFGSAPKLAEAIGRNRVTVWRWTQPIDKGGTDGMVPTKCVPLILRAARLLGVDIRPEDFIYDEQR